MQKKPPRLFPFPLTLFLVFSLTFPFVSHASVFSTATDTLVQGARVIFTAYKDLFFYVPLSPVIIPSTSQDNKPQESIPVAKERTTTSVAPVVIYKSTPVPESQLRNLLKELLTDSTVVASLKGDKGDKGDPGILQSPIPTVPAISTYVQAPSSYSFGTTTPQASQSGPVGFLAGFAALGAQDIAVTTLNATGTATLQNLIVRGGATFTGGFSTGGLFNVSSTGDITKIKGLDYLWPSTHALGVLQNDGLGGLTWGTLGASSITDNSLNFSKFSDALTLDASTDIALDNAEVFSVSNTGTGNSLVVNNTGSGNSFVVNDSASDTTPFLVNAAGNVGIGTTNPTEKLLISGGNLLVGADGENRGIYFGTSDPDGIRFGMRTGVIANTIAPPVYDQVFGFGWNMGRAIPSEPSFYQQFETHWRDGDGSHDVEWYLQYQSDTPEIDRPIYLVKDRTTELNLWSIKGDTSFYASPPSSVLATLNMGEDGLVSIGGVNLLYNTAKLEVWESTANTSGLLIGGNSGAGTDASMGFYITNGPTNRPEYARVGLDAFDAGVGQESGSLAFHTRTAGTLSEKMRVYYNGNIGIGTTAPTNTLSFGNATDRKIWIENSAAATAGKNLTIAAGSAVSGTDISGGGLTFQAGLGTGLGASTIAFQTGTSALVSGSGLHTMSTKMIIAGTGNVGIGALSPSAKLHISMADSTGFLLGLSATSKGIRFEPTAAAVVIRGVDSSLVGSYQPLSLGGSELRFETNGAVEAMRILSSGNVGIGQTAPSVLLHVGSTSVSDATSLLRLQDVDSACNFNANSGSPSCGSDQTLKKDITVLNTTDLLTKVSNLNPVSYKWLTDGEGAHPQYGFIAQEVALQFPELVTESTWIDGTTRKFLNIGGMMPYVVGAVKEINTKFASLGDTVASYLENAKKVKTEELCVGEVCVSESQFLQMVNNSSGGNQAASSSGGASQASPEPQQESEPSHEEVEDVVTLEPQVENPPEATPEDVGTSEATPL